ncbi:hypothetical protein Esti_005632 [Eimeria stiedai]
MKDACPSRFSGRRLRQLSHRSEGKETQEWEVPAAAFGACCSTDKQEGPFKVVIKTYHGLQSPVVDFRGFAAPATLAQRSESESRRIESLGFGNGAWRFSAVESALGKENSDELYVFTEEAARAILRQLVRAVGSLHALGIFHLDIKAPNVAVSSVCRHMLRTISSSNGSSSNGSSSSSGSGSSNSSDCLGLMMQGPFEGPPDLSVCCSEELINSVDKVVSLKSKPGRTGRRSSGPLCAKQQQQQREESRLCGRVRGLGFRVRGLGNACMIEPRKCEKVDFFASTPGTSKVAVPPEEVNVSYRNNTNETLTLTAAAATAATTATAAAPPTTAPTAAAAAGSAAAAAVAEPRGIGAFEWVLELEKEELLDGEKKDVYGLGCLLSQILTGQHPFIRPNETTDWR